MTHNYRKVYIIAEAGVNHNGDVDLACQMIHVAKNAGADAVKFQTFVPELLVTADAARAQYQQVNMPDHHESQLDMLRRVALSRDAFLKLKRECDKAGILFLSTPFDEASADFLEPLVPLYKISSGDAVNELLLRHIAAKGKPMIVSTGMCTLEEVRESVGIIRQTSPEIDLTLLHCTTSYPCPYDAVHLNAIALLREAMGVPVGYSDHTEGIEVSVAAVALGASVIEKNFTLDKTLQGPDHKASLNPIQLTQLIRAIRNVELAFGNAQKMPASSEGEVRKLVRKSLVTRYPIQAGKTIVSGDLIAKRPGTGFSPSELDAVVGRCAKTDLPADHVLRSGDLV